MTENILTHCQISCFGLNMELKGFNNWVILKFPYRDRLWGFEKDDLIANVTKVD